MFRHNSAKSPVFTGIKKILLLCAVLAASAASAKTDYDWKKKPDTQQWKSFFAESAQGRDDLWEANAKAGQSFETMAWEWRMAWVRACSKSQSKTCSHIMQWGLFDKALVVRAEAASRLGERFAGTGHKPAIRLLNTAYRVQQNQRSEKPLFVQFRILHALKQIGGEGLKVGQQLALNTPQTSKYWASIMPSGKKVQKQ